MYKNLYRYCISLNAADATTIEYKCQQQTYIVITPYNVLYKVDKNLHIVAGPLTVLFTDRVHCDLKASSPNITYSQTVGSAHTADPSSTQHIYVPYKWHTH